MQAFHVCVERKKKIEGCLHSRCLSRIGTFILPLNDFNCHSRAFSCLKT